MSGILVMKNLGILTSNTHDLHFDLHFVSSFMWNKIAPISTSVFFLLLHSATPQTRQHRRRLGANNSSDKTSNYNLFQTTKKCVKCVFLTHKRKKRNGQCMNLRLTTTSAFTHSPHCDLHILLTQLIIQKLFKTGRSSWPVK